MEKDSIMCEAVQNTSKPCDPMPKQSALLELADAIRYEAEYNIAAALRKHYGMVRLSRALHAARY